LEKITLLVPCKNEQGTIGTAIELGKRLPGVDNIVVIEGNSTDETFEAALRVASEIKASDNFEISVIKQSKTGKWNAIQEGLPLAKNNSIAIWDADLTVSFSEQCLIHERFLKSYELSGEFCLVTGNRMALREAGSMRLLNLIGNNLFSHLWSFLSGTYIPDLLCGSKVFSKKILGCLPLTIADKDPYGDFTIFASALVSGQKIEFQNLTYRARSYGQTNILRWSGGLSLLNFTLRFFMIYRFRLKLNTPK
jgi:glycosyltransferase involved in cell wall biosynthesis